MKYIVPLNELEQRFKLLNRFTTFHEKNALFVDDHCSIIDVVKELSDVVPKNEIEGELFLLKLREISVSDVIEVIITCPECDTINTEEIHIPELLKIEYSYFNDKVIPYGVFDKVEDILSEEDAENLPLKDYNKLEELLQLQNDNMIKEENKICRKCKNSIYVVINIRDVFSKSSPGGIFQEYIDISTFTNNGKLDIDSLYPYEREMFISIITDRNNKEST